MMTSDICIFVEGTYPYVTGGVSSWLHNLITNLPEFTFTICHLGTRPEPGRRAKYQFPGNVTGFQELYLNHPPSPAEHSRRRHSPEQWRKLAAFHDAWIQGRPEEALAALRDTLQSRSNRFAASELLYAPEAWSLLVERYRACSPSAPFLESFWTFRSTHLPLFSLLDTDMPPARLYHTLSTGYAGYAAALAKLQTGKPMLVTEHGIYTREREMEIALATWIGDADQGSYRSPPRLEIARAWWTGMFRFMSHLTYDLSDAIISITRANQAYQLRDGAPAAKLRLIPNGIDIQRFASLHAGQPGRPDSFTAGFVGRVVPIKDVKVFVQAIKIAGAAIPGLKALIIGPTDEDPDYFAECQELVNLLELGQVVQFTGAGNVLDYYRRTDAVVLTSLSEAQPLVILEANCAGIPVVATDVGACRDLLEGVSAADKALGPSGLLTAPASPNETAEAIIRLWRDETRRQAMARAGQARVQQFYRDEAMYAAYRELYQSCLARTEMAGREATPWPA